MKPLEVDVDGILADIGKIGKYQILTFVVFGFLPVILNSMHASYYIFAAYDVNHRCRIPDCDGNSSIYNQPWMENAFPEKTHCERYGVNHTWTPTPPIQDTCPSSYFDKTLLFKCQDGYVFEDPDTLVEQLNIPCEGWKRTLIGTLHSVGTLLALPIVGTFSDRYGRRHAMVIANIMEGLFGLIKAFSVNYAMFTTMDLLEMTLGSGAYSSSYVLTLEYLAPDMRVLGGSVINIFFGMGQMLMGLLAYLIPHWRTFLIVLYAPSFLIIFYYWIFDESPRWLISKFRFLEAKDNLLKLAKTNKRTIPEKALEPLDFNIQNVEQIKNPEKTENTEVRISPWREVLKSRILMTRVMKTSVWWITCTFCFYGLSINSAVLPGNKYVNFTIAAATEVPSHIFAYFGMAYFGRKRTLFTCYLISGITLLAFPFIPTDTLLWLELLCYFVGKLFITAAFNGVYLYTSELFPTTLRHSLLATCSMIGRIGSIAAPQTPLLDAMVPNLSAYLFAALCLLSALLMMTSPETLGRPLPDTVEDAENLSSSRKNIMGSDSEVSQSR